MSTDSASATTKVSSLVSCAPRVLLNHSRPVKLNANSAPLTTALSVHLRQSAPNVTLASNWTPTHSVLRSVGMADGSTMSVMTETLTMEMGALRSARWSLGTTAKEAMRLQLTDAVCSVLNCVP